MKNILIGIIGILIIGGGFWALKKDAPSEESPAKVEGNIIKTAWVEVERGTLFLKLPGQAKELKSGDIIESGASLETGKNSAAIVHFPDGSILSLDKETSVIIPQIEVNDANKNILIKITLTVGRVWSKVISLATPESEWEVKTSNTVATVRGTAFGMGFKGNTSWVNTSENKVAVSPVDPETKEKIPDAEIIIDDKKYVEIDNSDVVSVLKEVATTTPDGQTIENPKKAFLAKKIADVPNSIVDDGWVKQVKEKHKEVDKEVKDIETKLQDRKSESKEKLIELTEEKRKSLKEGKKLDVEKAIERITEKKENVYERKDDEKTEVKSEIKATTTRTQTETESRIAGLFDNDKILILTNDKLSVEEGQTIQFKAYAVREGGNVDVSDLVSWQVAGPIGVITKPGVFVAKLGAEVSEAGAGIGTVIITKKGEEKIVSTSAPINVRAGDVSRTLDIGGQ
ncbi:MAG: FecR domain-containing protein [Patescibacteria group bacterium]